MYTLTSELIDFLESERAAAALEELAHADLGDDATPSALVGLRRQFAPSEAAALLDQARLRKRAGSKFPCPKRLFFTEEALQQASSRLVSRYRMASFAHYARVADLGCGVGADTLALAKAGLEVLAVERDPIRARLAEVYVRACGFARRVAVVRADLTTIALDVDATFVDPSRPSGGRRLFGLESMEPPLSAILALLDRVRNIAVKIAPGVDHRDIPPSAEVKFISERGRLKEVLLRFGGLRIGSARTATVLPGPHQPVSAGPEPNVAAREPATYLYEPDPAVIRAGLLRSLGVKIGASQIDPRIAYLTSDTLAPTPFARAWSVERHGRFHLKTLNQWLREFGAGDVVVKKRGSAIEPEAFHRRLATVRGGRPMMVFLTGVLDRPWMIV